MGHVGILAEGLITSSGEAAGVDAHRGEYPLAEGRVFGRWIFGFARARATTTTIYLASGFWLSICCALLRQCFGIIGMLILLRFLLLCAPPPTCCMGCIFDTILTVHERFFCALVRETLRAADDLSFVD